MFYTDLLSKQSEHQCKMNYRSVYKIQNTPASVVTSMRMLLKYIFYFLLSMHRPPYLLLRLALKMFSLGW